MLSFQDWERGKEPHSHHTILEVLATVIKQEREKAYWPKMKKNSCPYFLVT